MLKLSITCQAKHNRAFVWEAVATPLLSFANQKSKLENRPLVVFIHVVGNALLRRAFCRFFSLSSMCTSPCVCRCGHQGGQPDHRAGEPSNLHPGTLHTTDDSLQTVQLRTHSIHPPYIDEDLQNRYAAHLRHSGGIDTAPLAGGTLVPTLTSYVLGVRRPRTSLTRT